MTSEASARRLARLRQASCAGDHLGEESSRARDKAMRTRLARISGDNDERAT